VSLLRRYLSATSSMARSIGHGVHGYSCLEDFVLRHGAGFSWRPGRAPVMGEPKQCYMNAAKMALDDDVLSYVEGYAIVSPVPIPVAHAWCVGEDGLVVDPTWDEGVLPGAREYFGVTIRRDYLAATLVRRGVWGVIDDWEGGWPMLSAVPAEWRDLRVKSGPGRDTARGTSKKRRTRDGKKTTGRGEQDGQARQSGRCQGSREIA
jgi:hypothetical protein